MVENLKLGKILDLLFERAEARVKAHNLIKQVWNRQLSDNPLLTSEITDQERNIYNTLMNKEFLVKESKKIYVSGFFVINLIMELLSFTQLHFTKRIVSKKCEKCGKKVKIKIYSED